MILIDGPENILRGLQDIQDLILELKTARTLSAGQFRVGAYATDRAITEIQGRGATVSIILNNEDLQARIDNLFQNIDGGAVA